MKSPESLIALIEAEKRTADDMRDIWTESFNKGLSRSQEIIRQHEAETMGDASDRKDEWTVQDELVSRTSSPASPSEMLVEIDEDALKAATDYYNRPKAHIPHRDMALRKAIEIYLYSLPKRESNSLIGEAKKVATELWWCAAQLGCNWKDEEWRASSSVGKAYDALMTKINSIEGGAS